MGCLLMLFTWLLCLLQMKGKDKDKWFIFTYLSKDKNTPEIYVLYLLHKQVYRHVKYILSDSQ
jgi:hypothetical protein